MKSTEKELGELHGIVAQKLKDAIEKMGTDTKGLASILNVARQFLKDNGIEAVPAPGTPVGGLAQKVAEFPYDPSEDHAGVH